MAKLARTFELLEPLRERVADGLPVLGTCAGMILLADRVEDGIAGQETIGGLDITVRRNAFGRQVDSFEEDLHVDGVDGHGARRLHPRAVGRGGRRGRRGARSRRGRPAAGRIVAVRQGPLMATSFHPEVGGDSRIHALFLSGAGTRRLEVE